MTPLLLLSLLAQIPEVPGTPAEHVRMRILEIAPGTGAPAQPGQKYTVHYSGWLTDGKPFDSSRTRNEPFSFVQGRRQVIAGWEAGFEGMRIGGKRRLFIPYQMAYGEKGRGIIPPKAELIFDVELLNVEDLPVIPAAQDLLTALEESTARLNGILDSLPANKLPRLTPQLQAIAESNQAVLKAIQNRPAKAIDNTPESLREHLKELHAELEKAPAGSLTREFPFEGKTNTVRGAYVLLLTRLADRLSTLREFAHRL